MIGADEFCSYDKTVCNVLFVSRTKEGLEAHLNFARNLGFVVEGNKVMCSKREFEAAVFAFQIKEMDRINILR